MKYWLVGTILGMASVTLLTGCLGVREGNAGAKGLLAKRSKSESPVHDAPPTELPRVSRGPGKIFARKSSSELQVIDMTSRDVAGMKSTPVTPLPTLEPSAIAKASPVHRLPKGPSHAPALQPSAPPVRTVPDHGTVDGRPKSEGVLGTVTMPEVIMPEPAKPRPLPQPAPVPSPAPASEVIIIEAAKPKPQPTPASEVIVIEAARPKSQAAPVPVTVTVVKSAEIKVGASNQFQTITGQVQQWRKTWRIRYAAVDQEDPYGGSLVLEGGAILNQLRDGQHVRIRGVLIPPSERTGGAAAYRVQTLETLD